MIRGLSIFVFLFATFSLFAQVATDNAGNYGSWTDSSNQGTGFGAWSLTTQNTDGSNFAGHFLGSSTPSHGDINTSGKAFGMYGNPSGNSPQANAQRSFNYTHNSSNYTELQDGHSFSIQLAVAYRNGYKGIDILESDSDLPFNFNVTNDAYYANGVDLGWTYDQFSIIQVEVTQLDATSIAVKLTRGSDSWLSEQITTSGRIGQFKCYIGNTQSGDENNLFFNNLSIRTTNPICPRIQVSPSIPGDSEQVTITFNADGTPLASASKVYLHSGVSTTAGSTTNFDRTVGNWGQDDGVGQMTNIGTDKWQFTFSSMRTFYSVDETEDVFGLNFLFRNADGSAQEDDGGSNYNNAVNTGDYFTITSPANSPFLAEINVPFAATSTASTAPTDWSLQEVDNDGNVLSTLATQTGGTTFTHNITLTTTDLKRYKFTSNFASGSKHKFFQAQGYSSVNEASRPAWTSPGINYHSGDATKVTLVLHAPVYTQYKKGDGTVSGTNTTTAKSVVYVVGDFNNWTQSETYKMNRDRDGWDGSTDADGDNDHGDYWWLEISGLTPGQQYVYQYLLDDGTQIGDPYADQVSDSEDSSIPASVYPGLPSYPAQAQDRASVLQTNQTNFTWSAPSFTAPSTNNLNIYEMLFRDFTDEGTYQAAIGKLDYIKSLGVNAIHVMPVSEFEGNSSWGYNPNFYFAPDKAYGTKNDLKQFIDECHQRQILVFNDIVLNHCFYSNTMARMYWNSGANKPANDNPWLNADHQGIYNTSGHWGADWNHESAHTQGMIDRILDYWLQEYNFDGFRFDFTKGFTQTAPDPGDDWASSYDQDRIDLLKRMVDGMWARNPGSVAIFEHLAESSEDKVLADHGILMWSGVGHHNAVKNMVLGWNADNPDIYTSGIYNAPGRNFNFANWMSYPESHDEERLAYELQQYGNGISGESDPNLKLEKIIDRLKIGYAYNLLFPGPRMIWQFGELGYDYSINYNGRTGEKPVVWTYYDNNTRKELYRLISHLFWVRNNHSMYATTPDYGNIGTGSGNITTPRYMKLSDGSGNHVIIIANLDPDASHSINPGYHTTGTWYKYNGDTNTDGSTFTVNNVSDSYNLAASELIVLTSFPINNLLPVEWIDFSGRLIDKKAHLQWSVIEDAETYGYNIQKSLDGFNFEEIGFEKSRGNTHNIQEYQFQDASFLNNAYYRIQQVDLNGQISYSQLIYLESPATQFSVKPNPFNNNIQISTSEFIEGSLNVNLYNTFGQSIYESNGNLHEVNNVLNNWITNSNSGIYFLSIEFENKREVIKLLKN